MIVIPAIDIKKGRCVRLIQGRMDAETVYSEDPVAVAERWEEMGATLIHIVDLDGAIDGTPKNGAVIKDIINSTNINVQIGGGIRDSVTAEYYLKDSKVKRVIMGTAAYEVPDFVEALCKKFPDRIAAGIDARDGKVAIRGWVELTGQSATDLATRLEGLGVSCIIYTNIARDGMLIGPDIKGIKEMVDTVNIPVIASGGVSNIRDIERLMNLQKYGVKGVIIGKALYSGSVNLKEAIELCSHEG
ncbi:MAG: 1-(5-phosphoribosyl)-5-[(5-phosphoribosylamino)methylideneamino]imidazole-4-carboxamide isomerase [Nitrospinae bacterium]|nr:1-(5-phosphoribosyl)-5-[(5-phosphoribosylamino)methylideneamino]imidazole-4-carboxamide isomerase [Nitrospinota bacterium]